jgi:tetratricopeptide (TPR) repeat protein
MASSQDRHSLAANLLLALASFLASALLLAALEGGLRLLGIGAPDATCSRLKYQQIYLPALHPASLPDGTPVRATKDMRLPFQWILEAKPENGLRVFTFGGSATAGLGFSPNVTFSRHLERMLEEAYPDRVVELINLGIVALSSSQVKYLVADVCQNYQPDLVIIYSGNNEFLEIHAEKYAAAVANLGSRIRDLIRDTQIFRAVDTAIHGKPKPPSLAEQNFSHDDLRLTQDRIIQNVKLTPAEIEEVVGVYEKNIDEMAAAALATDTPILLVTVASNWKWRGRKDLSTTWMDEFALPNQSNQAERLQAVREALSDQIEEVPAHERSALLFKRAVVQEQLENFEAAHEDYRAAMNEDPHLRRALDSMNDRVAEVAAHRRVGFVNSVEVFKRDAPHQIVGFEYFFDYVHFTPRGAVLLATELFLAIEQMRIIEQTTQYDPAAYRSRQLAFVEGLREDPLDLADWMGIGSDLERISDRDLWKYDRLLQDLDERLEADQRDVRSLVYRANANYFRVDGASQAERDYRAALALMPDNPEIRRNLERLLAERQP